MKKTTTKQKILEFLEQNIGSPVSGTNLAKKFKVSRTAVWKAIKQLEEAGYKIDATSGKGYTLLSSNDIVSKSGILKYLDADNEINIKVFDSVSSTNDVVADEAKKGAPEGFMAVACEQTGGKGRKGRAFFSPKDSGIYFSILLRPGEGSADPSHITTIAAVAVLNALLRYGVKNVGIKWVNDVYVNKKKICGILTEAVTDLETGDIGTAVVGIGLNIYTPEGGFPKEFADRAGSIFGSKKQDDGRNRLTAFVYEEFFKLYRKDFKEVADRYREYCFVIGRDIEVIKGDDRTPAKAIGVDDECRLMVEYQDGSSDSLFSGEISIKV